MPTPRPRSHLCEKTRPSRAQALFGSARPSARRHRAPPLPHSAAEHPTRWAPRRATPQRNRSTSTRPRRRARVRPSSLAVATAGPPRAYHRKRPHQRRSSSPPSSWSAATTSPRPCSRSPTGRRPPRTRRRRRPSPTTAPSGAALFIGAFDDAASTAPRRDASRTQEPGVKFQVKCTLLRPPPDGVSYGARVYVDRGEPDTVYTSAAVEGHADDGVDTSVPDHYFWFGPGETEYVARRPRRKPSRRRRHRGPPAQVRGCLLYTSPSPRDQRGARMPSSA